MASSSLSSHPALASSSRSCKYDVFLSFRGEDTRKTFVDHFYKALEDRSIHTYKDDQTLPRGEPIDPSLFRGIGESRIAVIIFSKNYADSYWCVEELAYIMKCRDERGLIVMPIFYNVDPSEVRNQKRKFGEAFAKQEAKNVTKAELWRKALVEVSNIAGWETKNIANGHESKVIEEIVCTILDRLLALNSDAHPHVLSWERRLHIACDAAEGLVYLHHGCRPSVVHRDVKSSNILLNEGLQAKLADFGLSRAFTSEDATYVSTVVAGTRGYLDPEYYTTNRLTEKTDVYGFGVMLLELITSRRALSENIHIISWVKTKLMLADGSIENIIDLRLKGEFDINTAWKVTEMALTCVDNTSVKRPTMNDMAVELKNCLQAEKTRNAKPNNQSGHISFDIENMSGPTPR